tara:strand:+ start:377 stop:505 length:129 start_codon:yes stop_codon:yes gene_type:complete
MMFELFITAGAGLISFLKAGEKIVLGIDKLGQQKHRVVTYED